LYFEFEPPLKTEAFYSIRNPVSNGVYLTQDNKKVKKDRGLFKNTGGNEYGRY